MPRHANARRSRSRLTEWVSGQVTKEMDEAIQEVAERLTISRSEVLRQALRMYLAKTRRAGERMLQGDVG